MAIVKCRECSKDVSDSAAICPNCGIESPGKALTPNNLSSTDNKIALVSIVVFIGLGLLFLLWLYNSINSTDSSSASSTRREPASLSERYPAPWMEDAKIEIVKALAQKHITGCGEFKYRQSYDHSREYLVYCTRDGSNWTSYIVFPRELTDSDVMGPYPTDASLPP